MVRQVKLMPRFFFHLFDGARVLCDPEGLEFPDFPRAVAEAQEDCRAFAVEELRAGRPFPIWSAVKVCDHLGVVRHIAWCKSLIPTTPFHPSVEAASHPSL